jgi:hypothetical protein
VPVSHSLSVILDHDRPRRTKQLKQLSVSFLKLPKFGLFKYFRRSVARNVSMDIVDIHRDLYYLPVISYKYQYKILPSVGPTPTAYPLVRFVQRSNNLRIILPLLCRKGTQNLKQNHNFWSTVLS